MKITMSGYTAKGYREDNTPLTIFLFAHSELDAIQSAQRQGIIVKEIILIASNLVT